ncbi:MAG: diacylglycerol/lipid kinase family protein [Dysgonomonas sp.]
MAEIRKKIHVIINPKSGVSSKQDLPDKIVSILPFEEFDIHAFFTEYAGHGYEIAKAAIQDKIDYVIAVGGDGTVNEVARALVNSEVALGIIPLGSGNGLARDLHIPLNVKKALEIIREENIIEIDYGVANDMIFFCTCGMGFDALVSEQAAKAKKRGSLMYLKTMLEIFFEQKPQKYEIKCPEGIIRDEAFVVTCANAGQYGYNAFIAPNADIQDGLMNIAILKPLTVLDVPQASIQLFTKNIDKNKKMDQITTSEAIIKREHEGPMHLDGDYIEAGKEIRVKIMPKGLKVLVPTEKPSFKTDPLDFLSSITRWI